MKHQQSEFREWNEKKDIIHIYVCMFFNMCKYIWWSYATKEEIEKSALQKVPSKNQQWI